MQYSFENEYCLIIGIQIEAMLGIHGEIEDLGGRIVKGER